MENRGGVADALASVYTTPALVPASPWLGDKPPARPDVTWDGARREIGLKPGGPTTRRFVVHKRTGETWETTIVPSDGTSAVVLKEKAVPAEVRVTAVDRLGNEGAAAAVTPGK
jgi:hypothetical protein